MADFENLEHLVGTGYLYSGVVRKKSMLNGLRCNRAESYPICAEIRSCGILRDHEYFQSSKSSAKCFV